VVIRSELIIASSYRLLGIIEHGYSSWRRRPDPHIEQVLAKEKYTTYCVGRGKCFNGAAERPS
jgi:hypothetical protein